MYIINTKLKSTSGMSILIALLFFLVCAVVGSLVLASATAAAGRYAELNAADLRYYHVVSATQYLEQQMNKRSVEIVKTKVTKTTTTVNASGETSEPKIEYEYRTAYSVNSGELTNISGTIPNEMLVQKILFCCIGDESNLNSASGWDASYTRTTSFSSDITSGSVTLSLSDNSTTESPVGVNVEYVMNKCGALKYIISSDSGSASNTGEIYKLTVRCNTECTVSENAEYKSETVEDTSGNSTTTNTETDTKKYKIIWKCLGAEKQ